MNITRPGFWQRTLTVRGRQWYVVSRRPLQSSRRWGVHIDTWRLPGIVWDLTLTLHLGSRTLELGSFRPNVRFESVGPVRIGGPRQGGAGLQATRRPDLDVNVPLEPKELDT